MKKIFLIFLVLTLNRINLYPSPSFVKFLISSILGVSITTSLFSSYISNSDRPFWHGVIGNIKSIFAKTLDIDFKDITDVGFKISNNELWDTYSKLKKQPWSTERDKKIDQIMDTAYSAGRDYISQLTKIKNSIIAIDLFDNKNYHLTEVA
jgi:hypothetical protein